MPYDITVNYPVNTPPIIPELLQGMRITESQSQFKFSNLECMAGDDSVVIKTTPAQSIEGVEAGVFASITTNTFGDVTIKKITSATEKLAGFTFLNFQRALIWSEVLQCFVYQKGDEVTIVTEGDYVGHVERAVEVLDPVYTRFAADATFTRIGALSNAAGTGLREIPGARFIQKLDAPGKVGFSLQDLY